MIFHNFFVRLKMLVVIIGQMVRKVYVFIMLHVMILMVMLIMVYVKMLGGQDGHQVEVLIVALLKILIDGQLILMEMLKYFINHLLLVLVFHLLKAI